MTQRLNLTRLPDWEERLNDWFVVAASCPFRFGTHDCLVGMAAGTIMALTGHDPGAAHRGAYRSASGSVRHLKKLGHDSGESLLDSLFERVPPAMARRGDLVMHEGNVGACVGGEALFIPLPNGDDPIPDGLARVALSGWAAAWRIG